MDYQDSLIFLSISPPQVQRFREPLKILLATKASKQLLRFLMLLVNQKDLWLWIETSKRRRNKLIKCKQSNILILRNLKLGFRVYHSFIKFDDWQAVCADLKEVPMSRLLELTTLNENAVFLHVTNFGDTNHISYTPSYSKHYYVNIIFQITVVHFALFRIRK